MNVATWAHLRDWCPICGFDLNSKGLCTVCVIDNKIGEDAWRAAVQEIDDDE